MGVLKALGNREGGFGLVSRALHWAMAAGILFMLGLGIVLVRTRPSLETVWLFGLHKSLGILLLVLALIRIGWHELSPPPGPLPGPSEPQMRLARWVRRALYLLMLAVPLAGWAGSAATGIDVVVFGRLTLPGLLPASEVNAKLFLTLHHWLAFALIGVLVLHLAGAAARAVRRDGTLRRMVLGRAR